MSEEEECPHGLDARWCSVCLHGVTKPEEVTVEYTFYAKRDGHCGECGTSIVLGQVIAKLSNERYVHVTCAP